MGPVKIGFQPPAPAQGGTGRAEEDINKYTNIGAGAGGQGGGNGQAVEGGSKLLTFFVHCAVSG